MNFFSKNFSKIIFVNLLFFISSTLYGMQSGPTSSTTVEDKDVVATRKVLAILTQEAPAFEALEDQHQKYMNSLPEKELDALVQVAVEQAALMRSNPSVLSDFSAAKIIASLLEIPMATAHRAAFAQQNPHAAQDQQRLEELFSRELPAPFNLTRGLETLMKNPKEKEELQGFVSVFSGLMGSIEKYPRLAAKLRQAHEKHSLELQNNASRDKASSSAS